MAWNLRASRDTGLHNITALCGPTVDTGALLLQRIGDTTWLMADNLRLAKDATPGFALDLLPSGSLPAGLRPVRSLWQNVLTGTGNTRRLAVSPTGWVPIYLGAKTGDVFHFTWGFPTAGPMPTSIPGVKL